MSGAAEGLDALCLALGHRFAKPELVVRALSHASLAGEESYERLEF
ncbi:MAG: ribonuclease III, partial [Alphaproteobacteria bacterium]